VILFDDQGKLVCCPFVVAQNIAQIWASILVGNLISNRVESGQYTRYSKITCLLGPITGGVGQRKITGIIFAPNL
jgi:hypothetical protein